jgi:hypothetical protein
MLACINALRMAKKLTPQQEEFADLVARGQTKAAAYRKVFPNSLKWQPKNIWSKASALAARPAVKARVAQIKTEVRDLAHWSREDSVLTLRKVATESEKGAEIVAAVRELNAMHGYHAPTKHEHGGSDGKPLLEELVKAVLGTTLPIRA